jgi:hypothetical protein
MNKWILHTSPLNTKNMYTIIRLSSIIFFMTFMLSSCDKDPLDACAEDPSCEYFRCKVNGEWWTPNCEDGPLFGCRSVDLQYYVQDGFFEMTAGSTKNNDGFYFQCQNLFDINTTYNFYSGPNIQTKYAISSSNDPCETYLIFNPQSSILNLSKIDKAKFLIEGKFSFSARNNCNGIIEITEGSFRQHYRF